jgi:hypothetical protein
MSKFIELTIEEYNKDIPIYVNVDKIVDIKEDIEESRCWIITDRNVIYAKENYIKVKTEIDNAISSEVINIKQAGHPVILC